VILLRVAYRITVAYSVTADESGMEISNAPMQSAESGKTRRETNENVIRFVIPFAKTVTYQSSYLIRACKTWNGLNSDLRNRDIGLQAFKSGLKTYYKYALTNIYKYDYPRT
jgi:hypothetical protein